MDPEQEYVNCIRHPLELPTDVDPKLVTPPLAVGQGLSSARELITPPLAVGSDELYLYDMHHACMNNRIQQIKNLVQLGCIGGTYERYDRAIMVDYGLRNRRFVWNSNAEPFWHRPGDRMSRRIPYPPLLVAVLFDKPRVVKLLLDSGYSLYRFLEFWNRYESEYRLTYSEPIRKILQRKFAETLIGYVLENKLIRIYLYENSVSENMCNEIFEFIKLK